MRIMGIPFFFERIQKKKAEPLIIMGIHGFQFILTFSLGTIPLDLFWYSWISFYSLFDRQMRQHYQCRGQVSSSAADPVKSNLKIEIESLYVSHKNMMRILIISSCVYKKNKQI